MHSFRELAQLFGDKFNTRHFPVAPATLYDPAEYFLGIGGKRVRPVMCLMGNELFDEIHPDAWHVANAIELFHNFTLIHDDIMDAAPLRRGMETLHKKYGDSTALLAGDVMLIQSYEYINKVLPLHQKPIMNLFNQTARQVCEGQQLDMDFEKQDSVALDDYIHMITLKTSVLLAASLRTGAIIGGAGEGNRQHLYEFGKNLGIAFQVQDDYLDAFGDPGKFGKDVGGDIRQNKKTFLLLYALEVCSNSDRDQLRELLSGNDEDKVTKVLTIFRNCNVDQWANDLKVKYLNTALHHLDEVAVLSTRKQPLRELADFLIQREY